MKPVAIGWNKKSSDRVQFRYDIQSFPEERADQMNRHGETSRKKKVRFNSPSPFNVRQAFENTNEDNRGISELDQSTFTDQNNSLSSRNNIFTAKSSVIRNEPICSTRTTVIVIVIAILIILMTAVIIGTVLGTLNSSSNAGKTSTSNTNGAIFSTGATTAAMISSISLGSQSGTPCSSYTTIDDPSRNVFQTGFAGSCDNGPIFNTSNNGAWIRFVGSGGTTIPSSSPAYSHCGGFATGWFNGTLPMTIGTMVNESICFSIYSNDCVISTDALAVYCSGGFYVYFLRPVPFCNARYCTI